MCPNKGVDQSKSTDTAKEEGTTYRVLLADTVSTLGALKGRKYRGVGYAIGAALGALIDLYLSNKRKQDAAASAKLKADKEELSLNLQEVTQLIESLKAQLKDSSEKTEQIGRMYNNLLQKPSQEKIERKMKELKFLDHCFHVAVVGNAGQGKSTFVNSIRGLNCRDEGAAPVGESETTMVITPYHPTAEDGKIVWYDVPGAGTERVNRWDYFEEQGLYVMDAIIIVWANRLTDTDEYILRNCAALGIPCMLVRSQCDRQIKSIRKDIISDIGCGEVLQDETSKLINLEVQAYRDKTYDVAGKTMIKAYEDANVPLRLLDCKSRVFLVNGPSLYKMMTQGCLDEYALDEERLLLALSFAMAHIEIASKASFITR